MTEIMQSNHFDFSDHIDQIRSNIKKLRESEYQKANFAPTEKSSRTKKPVSIEKTKELVEIQGKISQMRYNAEQNKKGLVNFGGLENNLVTFGETEVNSIENAENYVEWKKISNDERIEYMNDFLENQNYSENLKLTIIEMTKNGEILNKKDIDYDKINKRILSLPIVKKTKDSYEIKKKEDKKSTIKKIIKKK